MRAEHAEDATEIKPALHDCVELVHDFRTLKRGSRGAIVDADPKKDAFTVEVVDDRGNTLDLVVAASADLRVIERAAS